jgi:hypothetical protein
MTAVTQGPLLLPTARYTTKLPSEHKVAHGLAAARLPNGLVPLAAAPSTLRRLQLFTTGIRHTSPRIYPQHDHSD